MRPGTPGCVPRGEAVAGCRSLATSVGIASSDNASDSRQAEQRSSTAAAPERLEHEADLAVDVRGVGDRSGHFLPQHGGKAPA